MSKSTKQLFLKPESASDFLYRAQLLTQKLLKQGYVASRLKSSIQKFYGCHHNLVDRYELSITQMTIYLLLFM
jgi:hypothetical protein